MRLTSSYQIERTFFEPYLDRIKYPKPRVPLRTRAKSVCRGAELTRCAVAHVSYDTSLCQSPRARASCSGQAVRWTVITPITHLLTCCVGGFCPRAPLLIHIDGAICPIQSQWPPFEKQKKILSFVILHLTPRETTADQALRGPPFMKCNVFASRFHTRSALNEGSSHSSLPST